MHIWVDADACPLAIKEILYRAAERAQVPVTLVANRLLGVPRSPWIRAIQVVRGFDVADNEIARRLEAGDLVVTADIPLAADVVGRGDRGRKPVRSTPRRALHGGEHPRAPGDAGFHGEAEGDRGADRGAGAAG